MADEIFTIKARKCLRCGRLLTSSDAIKDGYGCQCKAKAAAEEHANDPIPGQMDIYDFLKNTEEKNNGKE